MRLYIGFITYGENTAKYLPYFLPSLKNQTFKDFKILAIDNSEIQENDNAKYIKENFSEIDLKWVGKNLGFSKAFNLMITQAVKEGAEYFLALNPDAELNENVLAELIKVMDNDYRLASLTPKVLKWDFINKEKTNIIDSCGIKLLPGLRFIDYKAGEEDGGNCGREIIGVSGVCAFYRLSALDKVKENEQYFDERMFMYKEDCDLAYRLFLNGFKAKCVENAVIYHDRSSGGNRQNDLAVILNRKNKSRQIKKWSFLNQQIIFRKYWKLQSWRNKLAIIFLEIKILVFVLFFEPYLLKELVKLNKIKNGGEKN